MSVFIAFPVHTVNGITWCVQAQQPDVGSTRLHVGSVRDPVTAPRLFPAFRFGHFPPVRGLPHDPFASPFFRVCLRAVH